MSTYEGVKPLQVFKMQKLDVSFRWMEASVRSKKIRCGPVAGDLSLFDPCSLIVGTVSCTDTSDIGQLWCHYEIEFINRQTAPTVSVPPSLVGYNLSSDYSPASGTTTTLPFDEALVEGFEITNTSGVFTLPPGSFRITAEMCAHLNGAATFTIQPFIFHDGVDMSPPQKSIFNTDAITGTDYQVTVNGYISSVATQTVSIEVYTLFSASTLDYLADQCRLFIQAV
jgi:hypothetical protein